MSYGFWIPKLTTLNTHNPLIGLGTSPTTSTELVTRRAWDKPDYFKQTLDFLSSEMQKTAAAQKFAAEKAELLASLDSYHRHWNREMVVDAYEFAITVHEGQWRQSGEPYFTHPLAVARILSELKSDYLAVVAGLLHDVVEDSGVTVDDVRERFGEQVALLVDGVTKISELRFRTYEERQAEHIRKMLLSMLKDLRVILIKFADRLHNMRTIDALPRKSQERIALETRDVYAPLAHRLGIARITREMEDLALRVLDRPAYDDIQARIAHSDEARQAILDEIIAPIKRELDRLGIAADVHGRVKSVSSIYNKIHKRGKSFDDIFDLLAIRIIVQQKAECYRALGLLHDLYTPVSEHFNDYIALPKSNLYQSLHTKIRDAQSRIVEVQIRTEEMHQLAQNGIAAHWRYKEGQIQPGELDQQFQWIRTLMEAHQEGAETGEFMESLKVDLFHDEIFVFTPKGSLIQLPKGATPIDFAFAIHSDVGTHTIGAKINGKIVPLHHHLESGDTVDVLTSPNQHPLAEWLKWVRTSRARSRIKRWFRETRWDQACRLGEEIISTELERLKLRREEDELREVAVSFGYVEQPDFFAALGSGVLTLGQVMRKLVPKVAPDKETLIGRIVQRVSKGSRGIRVSGFDNLVISIADCCNPLPGDSIVGFQRSGQGVMIHRTDCTHVSELLDDDRKVISVAWDVEREDRFSSRIHIIADDRPNLLHDVTATFASLKINILRMDIHIEDNLAVGYMVVEVRNLLHLTRLIGKINQIRGVLKVERQDIMSPEEVAA